MTEETEAPSAAPEVEVSETDELSGGKRLSPTTWAEIDTHWEFGTMTGAEIVRKYEVSAKGLTAHFKRHSIVKGCKAHLLKRAAEEKIVGAAVAAEEPLAVRFEQKRAGRIAETREIGYQMSAANFKQGAKLAKAQADGTRTPADCANDLKALRHMEMLIEKNVNNRLRLLNADQLVGDEVMPVLTFRDLSQEKMDAMANADADGDIDLDIPPMPASLIEEEDDVVIEEGVRSPST